MNERYRDFVNSVERIQRDIQKIKSKEMSNLGLKASHIHVLSALNTNGSCTSQQLSVLCDLDKAAISRAVKELMELGLIAVNETENRKRYGAKLFLTQKGEEVCIEMNRLIDGIVEEAGAKLAARERARFYSVLKEIGENVHRIAGE